MLYRFLYTYVRTHFFSFSFSLLFCSDYIRASFQCDANSSRELRRLWTGSKLWLNCSAVSGLRVVCLLDIWPAVYSMHVRRRLTCRDPLVCAAETLAYISELHANQEQMTNGAFTVYRWWGNTISRGNQVPGQTHTHTGQYSDSRRTFGAIARGTGFFLEAHDVTDWATNYPTLGPIYPKHWREMAKANTTTCAAIETYFFW
jgi:hypothetical protein